MNEAQGRFDARVTAISYSGPVGGSTNNAADVELIDRPDDGGPVLPEPKPHSTIDRMVITIDGPAGGGKSTVARRLSQRLNIAYLDTGAMYRAVAYLALERGLDLTNLDAVIDVARDMDLSLDCGPVNTVVNVEGRDVSETIRSLDVSRATTVIAGIQPIRDMLVAQQRAKAVSLRSFVSEGRDQGSVVFPDADVKFILEASPYTRAQRRLDDLPPAATPVTLDEMLTHVRERDAIDAKQWEPLLQPGAAICFDTTDLSIEAVVDRLEDQVRRRVGNG